MKKITFFDTKSYDKKFFDQFNKDYNFNLNYIKERLTLKNIEKAKDSDVICVFVEDDISKNIIASLVKYNVKLIALRCAGYNNVDLEYAKNKIKIVRVPSYSPSAVAEHAFGLILSLCRKIPLSYYRSRIGDFSLEGLIGFELRNKTIGLIGIGNIGKEMIDIANGFKMKVIAYDISPDKTLQKEKKFEFVSLNTLFEISDVISLHCPLTKDNMHLINRNTIQQMKDDVIIINTGRGKLINSIDLIEALKSKKIFAAGLDVYEEESAYFYHDYSTSIIKDDILARLIFFPNVLLTSHQGFFTKSALEVIAKTTLKNISDFFENKPLKNEVFFQKK